MINDLHLVAQMIARDVEDNADVAVALDDLASADGYTLQHSIDVAAIGMLVGQRLFRESGWLDHLGRRTYERRDRRLARLGLGLLLHDIGKLVIPIDVLNKPGQLDDGEWALMRSHPRAGVEMLRSDLISPLVKVVVRSHHERWDGGGYPDGPRRRGHPPARADRGDRRRLRRRDLRARLRLRPAARRGRADRARRRGPRIRPGCRGRVQGAWWRRTRPARRCACPTAAAAWWPPCRPTSSTSRSCGSAGTRAARRCRRTRWRWPRSATCRSPCVAGPGAEACEHEPPPLPTRPEPSADVLEAMRQPAAAPVAGGRVRSGQPSANHPVLGIVWMPENQTSAKKKGGPKPVAPLNPGRHANARADR